MSDTKDGIIEALKTSQLDLLAANARLKERVRVAEREVERLTERYVGNRNDCGHLKCFTRAPGLLVEGCQVCESVDVRAQVKAVRELREEMIACPDCPQPACRVHYDRFGEVYRVIMKELRW